MSITQAIVLAGGKGTRMYPLKRPKPLLPVAGVPILEHTLRALAKKISDVVIIVGHQEQQLRAFVETLNLPITVTFVTQEEQQGTYHALHQARDHVKDRFLVMNGDDYYSEEDIEQCLAQEWCILAQEVKHPERFGVLKVADGNLQELIEKPETPPSNLVNTGMYVLGKEVFDSNPMASPRGELELTDAVTACAKQFPIKVVTASYWFPIGYPWDLLTANDHLLPGITAGNQGVVEPGATIKGAVRIGAGTTVKAGSYIEGPVVIGNYCEIGPNCYIRSGTTLGDHCKVGQSAEIKNSIVGNNVKIPHLSYVGDSVLGDDINLGGGTLIANLRHDNKNIDMRVQGERIPTGRRKLGAVIGDGVKTGAATIIYPGRILDRNTVPGEQVKDI